MKRLLFAVKRLLLPLAALVAAAPVVRAGLPVPDPDDGAIKLPPGFRALVVADNLGPLRFLTVAPNGDVYVKTREVGIIALRDADGDGRAELKEAFGSGGGTGIALRDAWLYHSTTSAVYRYRLTPGELTPEGRAETVVKASRRSSSTIPSPSPSTRPAASSWRWARRPMPTAIPTARWARRERTRRSS